MSKPINCPTCGAKMKMKKLYQWVDDDESSDGDCAYYYCTCGLRGPTMSGRSWRGAATRAGRAMRAICDAVEARVTDAFDRGQRGATW